ncbi:YoaK family protein [Nocardia stercoris]|uniref:DUF1275 domain-containing protein n=1 Tax=Nocardia stercoris TaxID=2483361 RepID=A0A3M2L6U1_9NOCA|nr:YoaK family protein [Nocardia stercoris]RMI33351.1 DUF1275 domain-containing protein [Nocardia stercoris]
MTATSDSPTREKYWTLENRLAAALLLLAGFVGAIAFARSDGYFVTFMTGNTERAVVGGFVGHGGMAIGAAALIACFLGGVLVGSILRRRFWRNPPGDSTLLCTVALAAGTVWDNFAYSDETPIPLGPILCVAFAMGALNTAFVRNGEVSIPVTYVTGTMVKLMQGIERHLAGGTYREWLGYAVQYTFFLLGALLGGLLALVTQGSRWMLYGATIGCAVVCAYTWWKYRRS